MTEEAYVEYEKDTLGYHRNMASAVFGPESKSVAFLDEKAALEEDGLNARVVVAENQMVLLLTSIEFGGGSV